MGAVVKVEWTETSRYLAYIELPEGQTFETFDKARYDLENGLADLNEDRNFEGCERHDIEVYDEQPPRLAGNIPYDVDELDWESLEGGP